MWEDLSRQFGEQVNFVVVYQAEAHASDRWDLEENHDDAVCFPTPQNLQQRIDLAKVLQQRYDVNTHILVDDLTNEAMVQYSAWPERLFVIDHEKKDLRFVGGPGPFWYTFEPMPKVLQGIIQAAAK